uniref:Uncharacterized protein n=2 Tax=Parascaris univalens TaxID=6257 RepID=A0A915BMA4_PARUN
MRLTLYSLCLPLLPTFCWLVESMPIPKMGTYGRASDTIAENNEERTEFVRTTWSEAYYTKLRTFSTVPRRFDCFSCMSLSYQESWEHLQSIYTAPKVFTNRCNDPYLTKNIPTVQCGSVCVSLLEPDVEAGVFIGYKYIRGCLDRVLRNGFNETALRTHRFHQ